jgi:DNA-binding NarL/FixJ family response regulator
VKEIQVLVRAGIRALLEKIDHVQVVGEAGDGVQALELIEELGPDVVLLDLTMPGLSGFEVLEETSERFPDVSMIVLSVHDTVEYALHALRAGASGYLPKSALSLELEMAIQSVLDGEKYVSPSIARKTALEFSGGGSEATAALTPRQLEVLTLIAEGFSTKEIARTLEIGIKTVETHRSLLMKRLNIHEVAGLVRYAIKKGLLEIDR